MKYRYGAARLDLAVSECDLTLAILKTSMKSKEFSSPWT